MPDSDRVLIAKTQRSNPPTEWEILLKYVEAREAVAKARRDESSRLVNDTSRGFALPERREALQRVAAQIKQVALQADLDSKDFAVDLDFDFNLLRTIPHIREKAPELRYALLTTWGRQHPRRILGVHVTLGLEFLRLYTQKRWFCEHPWSGRKYLILAEDSNSKVYQGQDVRDCCIFTPAAGKTALRALIKRVYVDPEGRIAAIVRPLPKAFVDSDTAVFARLRSYPGPSQVCRVPKEL